MTDITAVGEILIDLTQTGASPAGEIGRAHV